MTPKSNYLSFMNKENYMGFKKLSEQGNTEESFINSARGETSTNIVLKKAKKNKPFTINFTEDELNEIRLEAQKLKMNVSQYMRFKIFNT